MQGFRSCSRLVSTRLSLYPALGTERNVQHDDCTCTVLAHSQIHATDWSRYISLPCLFSSCTGHADHLLTCMIVNYFYDDFF